MIGGLREIIEETEEYGLNRELILDRLKSLVGDIIYWRDSYVFNPDVTEICNRILGPEVKK